MSDEHTHPDDLTTSVDAARAAIHRGPLATFFATDVRRESACPVHFVWDGNGQGRPWVRIGFVLALLAGAAASFASLAHASSTPGRALGAAAAVVWLVGQVLTRRRR
jgi:hypothetical protein